MESQKRLVIQVKKHATTCSSVLQGLVSLVGSSCCGSSSSSLLVSVTCTVDDGRATSHPQHQGIESQLSHVLILRILAVARLQLEPH